MKTASISHLKNHLSASLKQVVAGESLLVTDRNRPVAMLTPLSEFSMVERLAGRVAEGIVRPPKLKLDVEAFLQLPKATCEKSLSQAIIEERQER
jgi:prevent-host-death family protein